MSAPRLCPSGAAGGARRGGFGGGRGNLQAFGRRTAEKTGANGAKSRTRGRFRASGAGRAPGFEAAAGAFSGARREKVGRRRGKTGRSGVLRGRVRRALGAKSPLLPRKGRATGLWRGENWRRKLAGCVGLSGAFRESSGGFGGKSGASKKPFRAHIGRTCPLPRFFVDGAPSLGAIIWWFGRVAFFASQSDECVTPRAGKAAGQGRHIQ